MSSSENSVDEPTSGVDPVARRCLWEAIGEKLKQGCSIVLTSHSMEECEALCNRLIIMVNGEICCIGSPLHLKNKFSNGYTVHIRVSSSSGEDTISSQSSQTSAIEENDNNENKLNENIAAVQKFISETFPTSSLKAVHNNMLHYSIETSSFAKVKCSQIFGAIEKEKLRLMIEDYSVSQTSLEQIFLNFARKQRDEDRKNDDNRHTSLEHDEGTRL